MSHWKYDVMGWPQGWDRTNPFRVVNFLGKTGVATHQNVITDKGQRVYFSRKADRKDVLEIRFMGRTAYAYQDAGMVSGAYVDWPEPWAPRKGSYVPHAWRHVVREALKIANI